MDYEVGNVANIVTGKPFIRQKSHRPNFETDEKQERAEKMTSVRKKTVLRKSKAHFSKKHKRAKIKSGSDSSDSDGRSSDDDTDKVTVKRKSKDSSSGDDTDDVENSTENKSGSSDDAESEDDDRSVSRKRNARSRADEGRRDGPETEEERQRTIYVGNWPLAKDNKTLAKYFSKYGKIETSRLRSIPIGDPRQSKKVAYITKNFHRKRTSCEAYVKFEKREYAVKALKENGAVVSDHHLMVNIISDRSRMSDDKAIFVGNIPFDCEDDHLWNTFGECGRILNVHIARSRDGISRGFGFVNFESMDGVELALKQDAFTIDKRELRVKRVGDKHRRNIDGKRRNPYDKSNYGDGKRPRRDDFKRRDGFKKYGSDDRRRFKRSDGYRKFDRDDGRKRFHGSEYRDREDGGFRKFGRDGEKKNKFRGFRTDESQETKRRYQRSKSSIEKQKLIQKLNPRKEKD